MTTLMEFIVAQSSLPIGNTIRDHLESPGGSGPGGTMVLADGLEVLMDERQFDVDIDLPEFDVEIINEFDVEIDLPEFDVEID